MHSEATRRWALALLTSGRSVSDVSRATGVSRASLRHWRDHDVTPSRPHSCFVCHCSAAPADAYAALFGYYLGDGWLSNVPRKPVLRVSCDLRYPGVIRDVETQVRALNRFGACCQGKAPGCVAVQSTWKHWPCLFPQHGPGRKHERALGMTQWQWEIVESHPADFLRGLFHSDGCRVRNWATRPVAGVPKRYEYPRWQFTNHSEEILGWCGETLDLVGIPWRRSSWKVVSVSQRAAVAELDRLIGPKC